MNKIIHILRPFYSESLNELVRIAILNFQIPLIQKIFHLEGATIARPRGSVFQRGRFNFLLSDVDFSLVAPVENHPKLFSKAHDLKKVFLNLGELEVYTTKEWEELNTLMESPLEAYWARLQLIRKSKWQREKLSLASEKLEVEKQMRGLRLTLSRLGSLTFKLRAIEVLDLNIVDDSMKTSLPYFSSYLERKITLDDQEEETIIFDTEAEACSFLSTLPDTDLYPKAKDLRDLKLFMIRRERILASASRRVKKYEDSDFDDRPYQLWLNDLNRREALTLKD